MGHGGRDTDNYYCMTTQNPTSDIHLPEPEPLPPGAGINVSEGTEDDGWETPPLVKLADGTAIQLLKDGAALRAAFEAIRQARHRICLESYIYASDETGRAFSDLLIRKSQQGVKVYVIYDSAGSFATDRKMFGHMRQAGIYLQAFHPIRPWECRYSYRPFNRDHRKVLVVDDHLAGLGGLNVATEYAGSWIVESDAARNAAWRDNAIAIIGPGAKGVLSAFAAMWRYIANGGRIARASYVQNIGGLTDPLPARPHITLPDADQMGLVASVPSVSSPLDVLFRQIMAQAKSSIDLTMAYFAPTEELINVLCRAARRGVKVRLMLPSKSDLNLLIIAARSFYPTLMGAGVEIHERTGCILHAKTLVVDERMSVIGSANLDYRSIEFNCEISAIVHSAALGRQMRMLFENDMNYSRLITREQLRHRPLRDRVTQWAVKRARYLL